MSVKEKRKRKLATGQCVDVPSQIRPLLEKIGRIADQERVSAYAVGGCVRDWLLGVARTTDLDVALAGDGIVFANRVAKALGTSVKPHEQFGTATLVIEQAPGDSRRPKKTTPAPSSAPLRIDVASCRKERYAEPAAYPKVTSGSLQDDLFRRDFTINAMAVAINPKPFGQLIDPFGGFQDLQARRLRILHPNSFLDDPSRILRAVRFAQRFGLTLEPKTAQCLRQAVASGVLSRLNRGRLRKELDRMVEEPDPLACLSRLSQWLAEALGKPQS